MSNKYQAEQYISISASGSGTEIELHMVVEFTVHPGRKSTMIDPAEMPLAEVDRIRFFEIRNGKTSETPTSIPGLLWRTFSEGEDFHNWMLAEALQKDISDADDYADQRREMMWEERL